MQSTALRTLEFDRIREALAAEALTALGRERAEALSPSVDAADVQARLELTAEAVAFVRTGGSLAISAPDDLPLIFELLAIQQQPLEPMQLLGLARFVASVGEVADGIRQAGRLRSEDGGGAPQLDAIAQRVASFEAETRGIRRAIHPSGDVNDNASPLLQELRDKLRRQRAKLRSTLDGLARGRDTAKYLQDQVVTDRNGRYVLILRAEHRDAIPGIVHGASTSGASLYVEPLATMELNNEVVALVEREREEVRRILLALTDAFRQRDDDFASLVEAAADLDELFAKVELARRTDGVAPMVDQQGGLELRGARHPLLIPAVRDLLEEPDRARVGAGAAPSVVVGTDILVSGPTRALVISGPNTGGKTVALKAAGLLALMAQAGLFIPVDAGSRFTPFRSVFADIGDEQSISASLSTFSAHIANIVAMDRALALPALVLLDEVGGGTDPAEGGALGTAVIDHFRNRGAVVIATTHDDALKSFAATTAGVSIAAFGFDPSSYAPTYKLIYGAPGRSLALEIAERLGMPPTVVAAARGRRSTREAQLADHLARVDRELAALDAERRQMQTEREAMAAERRALLARESQITEREAVLRRRMDEKLNDRLREARQEVDRIVADLKGRAGSLVRNAERTAALSTGDIGGLRAEARTALESIADQLDSPATSNGPAPLTEPPDVGNTVFVAMLGAEGIVRSVSGKQVEVEVRGKRMRVALKDLRRRGGVEAGSGGGRPGSKVSSLPPRLPGSQPSSLPARDLVLIGATVDEAVDRAEKFLDQALLADERRLRIVHGHGTGRLRDALRRFFREHPLVAGVTPAAEHEGGEAATIVELKE